MTAHNKFTTLPLSFKLALLLLAVIFAVATIVLIIASTSAATVTGRAPSLAISLADELNTGILGPGEQRWFKLTALSPGQSSQVEQSLTLFYTPGDENLARRVSLQLFEQNQLPLFYEGDTGQMVNFGAGQPVSRDNNPNSGELFWTGWLFDRQNYYIQLNNGSQIPIDYWLFSGDVSSYALGEAEVSNETTLAAPAPPVATVGDGSTPHVATPLLFNTIELKAHKGMLAPGQEVWYNFSAADLDGEYFEEVALTMFATPNEANQATNLTFEVFTAGEIQAWSPGNQRLNNIGAGGLVQRDNDPLTTEHFWTGWVVDSELYYVRIRNGSIISVDYWLFTEDVYNPELGS